MLQRSRKTICASAPSHVIKAFAKLVLILSLFVGAPMASLRDIAAASTSVKNTQQITRAMKLVARAKLRRATDACNRCQALPRDLESCAEPWVANAGEDSTPRAAR